MPRKKKVSKLVDEPIEITVNTPPQVNDTVKLVAITADRVVLGVTLKKGVPQEFRTSELNTYYIKMVTGEWVVKDSSNFSIIK